MYKNYIFDLYGTLVDIRTNEDKAYLWDKMAELFGFYGAVYDRSSLKKAYLGYCKELENEMKKNEEYPEIDLDIVIQKLFADKGIEKVEQSTLDALQMSMRVISTKFIRLYDGVKDLLENLKIKEKNIYLLSNAQRGFTRPELRYLGIEKYFDGILISSEEGCKKPGNSFYQRLLDRYNLNPKDSIMIGNDSVSDILGACGVGMDSLYIHTEISPECVEDLRSTYTIMDGDFTKIKELILK
ncbi:MAG: HAD family hydrolase [Lachnospiraceae bacterium]|nr:HAD family hydrolase [Lachnospiraceae bacterium]